MKMISRREIPRQHKTYNLHIENDHNYIVDGAVVANCHAAKADMLKDQLSTVFKDVPIRWGLTGTIPKEEHHAVGVKCTLGEVVGELGSKELQDMGVLANLDISILQMQDGPLGFNNYQQELKWLTTDPERIEHIASMIDQISQTGNTLVLIDRIETGEMMTRVMPDWVFVNGSTRGDKRTEHYDEISDSDNRVIVATYGVAAVGINIPRIFNLIMIEPGKSFIRVIQSIGRGVRKAQDKDYVQVYDITSNLKYSKRHLTKRRAFYREKQFPNKVTKIDYK